MPKAAKERDESGDGAASDGWVASLAEECSWVVTDTKWPGVDGVGGKDEANKELADDRGGKGGYCAVACVLYSVAGSRQVQFLGSTKQD